MSEWRGKWNVRGMEMFLGANCLGMSGRESPGGDYQGKCPKRTSGDCPDSHEELQVSACSGHDLWHSG